MPSRRHNDPLAPPRRGLPLLRRFAGARTLPGPAIDGWDDQGVSGAVDATAWSAALEQASADPRATPLSAVRMLIEAPALTDADRADELARLQAVAAVRWREILRPADTLAQVGPSEFAVLLPRCDATAAETIAGRLQQAVPEAARSRAGVATSARGDGDRLGADAARALAAAAQRTDPLADPRRLAVVTALRAELVHDGAQLPRDPELDNLAHGTATLLGADAVAISLIDDALLHLTGAHGVDTLDGSHDRVPVDRTLCRHAVASSRPVLVSDTARHGVAGSARAELALGISACASVPISTQGVIVGTVCALRRDRYEWTDDDTAVLRVAAERAEQRLEAALRRTGRAALRA